MKKSRKLLPSTIAVAVVASASVTVAVPTITQAETVQFKDVSTNAYYYNDVQWLVQEGIITGYSDGTYQPNKSLSREEAAAMFVRALKLDKPTNSTSILEKYKDINQSSWSAADLAAFINEGINDDDTSYFYPSAPLTREVMASWLVNAFQFKEKNSTSVPFTDIDKIATEHLSNVKTLYQNEIVQGNTDGSYAPKSGVTRAQFAIFMKRAMTSPSRTDEVEKTTPLKFEEAKAINLKQVKITANHAGYNTQQVTNQELYKIEDSNGNKIKVANIQLNQKEITLTLEKALKDGSAKLVVDSAITGEVENFRLNFSDREKPTVTSIKPTGKNSYVIYFSEPLDFGVENGKTLTKKDIEKTLELNDYRYSIEKATVEEFGQALHIELESNLREGEFELEFLDTDWLHDYAGNELRTSSFDFTMKYEKTAPQLIEVKNVQPNQATLVFDRYIKLRYRGYLYHTSSAHYPSKAVVQNGNELVLTFDSNHMITKSTDIILENGAVEDLWGNQNTKATKAIQVAEDKTPPTIESVEFVDSTVADSKNIKMKVTFSESVKKDIADDIDNYKLKDGKGTTIKIKDIRFENSSTNDKIATFTIDRYYGELPKQQFTLQADKIKDLVGNVSDEFEYSFTTSSEKPPGDFTAKMITNDDEESVRIIIDYGKKMSTSGSYSINQLDLYELKVNKTIALLDDLHRIDGFNVTFKAFDNGKKAEILIEKTGKLVGVWDDFFWDLVEAVDDDDLDDVELVVGRLADEDDNRTQSIVNKIKLSVQGEFSTNQVTAKAIDDKIIKLTFDEELTNFDDDDFIVFWDRDSDGKFDSNEKLDSKMSMNTVGGKSVITIKLDDKLDADGRYDKKYVYVVTDSNVKTKTRYGQTIKINNLRVQDGIAPKIDTYRGTELVYVQPVTNDSSRAIVSLEFTDDIDKNTLTRLSFVIGDGKDYEVESAVVENNDKISLVVKLNGNRARDLVGEYVKQKAAISDDNDNIINNINVRINEEKSSRSKP
ncbi:S-layer homology domain-containing protein [Schinkia azotoformans]|uniref:S-layer homology domain-containing protein n=1 Tax=Schinkia azotoformans TaxID=1454 RepID=UPI002E1EAB32|nr:S-layer homology domain-containing protein [Schinkia azotoformans]